MDTQTIDSVRYALGKAHSEIYGATIIKEPVKPFYKTGTHGVSESLRKCTDSGYKPLFMPELAIARSKTDGDSMLWKDWFLTTSIIATGRTKGGNPVVVYAHVQNPFNNPDNIRNAVNGTEGRKIVNGAGTLTNEEFYQLLDQQGNGRVFVVDYDKLESSTSGIIKVKDALEHPQTIPFLGSKEIAEAYIDRYQKVHDKNIGVWYYDDLGEEPRARLLCAGSSVNGGLFSSCSLDYSGRVLGVAPEAQCVEKKVVDEPKAEPLEARVSGPSVELLNDGRLVRVGGIIYVRAEGLELRSQ